MDMENGMASDPVTDQEHSLDTILVQIGEFGLFQIIVFLLISLPMLFGAMYSITFVFTASTVVQRCNITECDTPESGFYEPWTEFSIPKLGKDIHNCQRYVSLIGGNSSAFDEFDDQQLCYPENFGDEVERCPDDNFIFRDNETTLSNEFGIFCSQDWKLAMVGTLNNIGQFVGIPIGGVVSDKFGRQMALVLGALISTVIGIVKSFSPTFNFLLAMEFLENIASSTLYTTCFILAIELVGPAKRVLACSLITIFYAIGEVLLAIAAKYYQNWRIMLRIIYIPGLVHIVYFWVLPESVRWLLSQKKDTEAKVILKRAAAVNKRKLSETMLDNVIATNRKILEAASESSFPIRQAFRQFSGRIINCCFCWIINILVYFGLSFNAVLLDGNKYNNFIFIALVEIPGFLLPVITMDRIGRRYSLFSFMLVSGLCCLGTVFVPDNHFQWELTLFLIGKMAITAGFQAIYFFTSEIFPTNIRSSMLSFCSCIGRVGSILAPQTPLLAKYNKNAPALVFGIAALLSAIFSLFFPETRSVVLPSTIKEAVDIGVKKKAQSVPDQTS